MNEYIKLAWRNIWRNRRRTMITSASIFFAIFFSIILHSFQTGAWSNFLDNLVSNYSGHMQIQNKDYFKNQTINFSMPYTNELHETLNTIDEITSFSPVIQCGGLASSGEISKIGIVFGVDLNDEISNAYVDSCLINIFISEQVVNELKNRNIPNELIEKINNLNKKYYKNKDDLKLNLKLAEEEMSFLDLIAETAFLKSEFISKKDNGVNIGFELAKYLELEIGDSIIILGQGYHGATAAGKYRIKGLLKFPAFEFNNSVIYMPIKTAQILQSAYVVSGNLQDTTFLVNYVRINTNNPASLDKRSESRTLKIKDKVEKLIANKELDVVYWQKINPEMTQLAGSKQGSSKIISFMLYLIIGFGIFGTVLMMIAERKREFGIMIAIGMKKGKLAIIVILEMILLSLLGIVSGSIATLPIVLIGHYFPLKYSGGAAEMLENLNVEATVPFQNVDFYYLEQAFTVLFIVALVIIYPVIKIIRTKVI